MNNKILLVDDEKDIVDLLEEVLRRDGFQQIRRAYAGKDAVELCRTFQPEVMVLDVMLPDVDGIEVCTKVREFSHCSILFLSSRNDEVDKILGLFAGGDDYVTKPFSPREVVFRIKAQLRRQQYQTDGADSSVRSAESGLLKAGPVTIDPDACRACLDGQEISLTGREFLLLSALVENADKIISKERLYELVWGESGAICDNTIMVHIRHIREKIEKDPSNPQLLLTVKGLGYKFRKRSK